MPRRRVPPTRRKPAEPKTNHTACKYGEKCKNKSTCKFYHEGYRKKPVICSYGSRCTRKGCFYVHPGDSAWVESTEEPFKYDPKGIWRFFLSPSRKLKPQYVPNEFESFRNYAHLLIENHLCDYYKYVEILENKPYGIVAVEFRKEECGVPGSKQIYFVCRVAKSLVPPTGLDYYLFKYNDMTRDIYCVFTKPNKTDIGQDYVDWQIRSQYPPQIYNPSRMNKIVVLGYIGNFTANILSLITFALAEKDILDKYKNSLVEPVCQMFTGDYLDSSHTVPKDGQCNHSQKKACDKLKNGIEIIQGPPGTGKSTTISAIIEHRVPRGAGNQTIVTSTRNQALNSIVEKLENSDLKILVFGNEKKLYPASKRHWVEDLVDQDSEVVSLKSQLSEFMKAQAELSISEEKEQHKKMIETVAATIRCLYVAKNNAFGRLAKNADVVLATIAAIGKIPAIVKAHTLIVDEAGCMEEISVAPLLQLAPANLVLVGDHKQLPPLVFTELGVLPQKSNRVSRSLMERLIDCGVCFRTLRVQYRMHRDVMQLVSTLFYDGKLVMGDIPRPRPSGVLWADSAAVETSVDGGGKVFNLAEVDVCAQIYSRERQLHPESTIKIITFYVAQLKRLINGLANYSDDSNLSVVSVDASQGSEADCVIISCVRNNADGKIGFLKDSRRLNVAISRAKEVLYFVGNREFFKNSKDEKWLHIVNNCPAADLT